MSNKEPICTTDPQIIELETADGEVITDYDDPSTPIATAVHRITFRDRTGAEHTIAEGDTFIDDADDIVGPIIRIRADESYGGDVTHYVYIDYGAGDYDATGEGGVPLGEVAKQLAADDIRLTQ